MMQDKTKATHEEPATEYITPRSRHIGKKFKIATAVILALLLIPLSYVGYIYAASPEVIRKPKLEHYHFRMQILVDGKAEDFATREYQIGYAKDQCNANLPEQPIHFHDNKDQFVHIHWEGMTGGMVMKYYGWNYIGGIKNALGYKLDKLSDPQKVTTHGNFLPTISKDANFYIYTGDANNFKERNFDDWVKQDLETFFGTTSNFPAHKINKGEAASILNTIFPKASAHDGVSDGHVEDSATETEQEKLTRINNLVGDVVIFVQKDKPTDQQIKDRFNKVESLSDSTCGG